MTQRSVIGVNLHVANEIRDCRTGEMRTPEWFCIEAGYPDALAKAGAQCLIFPPASGDVSLLCDLLDGLVMIGGGDYDPVLQGYHRTAWNTHLVPARRETFDRKLIHEAQRRRLPILAIGAGMQLLNTICGGTLFYDQRGLPPRHAASGR